MSASNHSLPLSSLPYLPLPPRIDNEYMLSAKKEEEIKKAFERIKKETGINETKDKESKELLNVFINLYQKNTIMKKFVEDLNKEVDELER